MADRYFVFFMSNLSFCFVCAMCDYLSDGRCDAAYQGPGGGIRAAVGNDVDNDDNDDDDDDNNDE